MSHLSPAHPLSSIPRARSRHYYEIFVITPGYASQVRKPVRMESTTLAGEINVEEIVEKL
jgi:hypothetical protein